MITIDRICCWNLCHSCPKPTSDERADLLRTQRINFSCRPTTIRQCACSSSTCVNAWLHCRLTPSFQRTPLPFLRESRNFLVVRQLIVAQISLSAGLYWCPITHICLSAAAAAATWHPGERNTCPPTSNVLEMGSHVVLKFDFEFGSRNLIDRDRRVNNYTTPAT